MSRLRPASAALVLLLAHSFAACSDDDDQPSNQATDAGPALANDAGRADIDGAAVDAGEPVAALTYCLPRPPGELPRAPGSSLPCDLLPPGFVAP